MNDANSPPRGVGDALRRKSGVIPSNGDQMIDSQGIQRRHTVVKVLLLLRRIRSRRPQYGTAMKMNRSHFFGREFSNVILDGSGIRAFHQPLEAIQNSEHTSPTIEGGGRRGANDAIDSRGRPSADEDSEGCAHVFSCTDDG